VREGENARRHIYRNDDPFYNSNIKTQSPDYIIKRAKELKKAQTPAEESLWSSLRNKRLDGIKFSRQHPRGKFIVDFYCPKKRLIIELDGVVHDARQVYDGTRDNILIAGGFRIYRIKNKRY
jgi:very-short-patch-repair endonuclease